MVIRELITETVNTLRVLDNYMFEAHLIVRTVLALSPLELVLNASQEVSSEDLKACKAMAERRLSGEPLQYILGTQEFMGMEFEVSPSVLIPRSDTETLVETVLTRLGGNGAQLLEIGSGSGCISLSLAYYNKNLYVRSVDISSAALELAEKNALKHNLSDRVKFEQLDILTETPSGRYGVIVSNPPYIETDIIGTLDSTVKDFEPRLALDGGKDGLKFYRRIIKISTQLLSTDGILAFEVGEKQAESVAELMRENFTDIEIINDLCGIARVVVGKISVKRVTDMKNIKFDFGSKPVADGYTKITADTVYSDLTGYGLEKTTTATERPSGNYFAGNEYLLRDYLDVSENTFKCKLENGSYMVRIYSGDYVDEGDVTTTYTINGQRGGFWVSDGCVMNRVHKIDITDGMLEVIFNKGRHSCLNAIEISPCENVPLTGLTCNITAEHSGCSVNLAWDKCADFYFVVRRDLRNGEITLSEKVVDNSYTDTNVALCENYNYTVFTGFGCGFKAHDGASIDVTVKNGEPLSEPVSGFSAEAANDGVKLSWNSHKDAVCYRIYQKAPYGKPMLICETAETSCLDTETQPVCDFVYSIEAITLAGITERSEAVLPQSEKPFKRKMETLDRGAVAIKTADGVFVSWRLNAYEYNLGIKFMLYKNGKKLFNEPLFATNYLDKNGKSGDSYTVKAVKDGKAEKEGYTTVAIDTPYIPIPLDKPDPVTTPDGNTYEYHANDAAVADLDGDGEYEIVIKWVANGKDNSHKGYTGVTLLDGYKLNGKRLWRINLGINIREGAHYTQFMVYDFDNDGKAEIICKTADGTIDGAGTVIGDINADYRNQDGFILEGPEFLTVFSGETGAIIDTVDYDPPRGNIREWGDSWGNRVDRFLACVAYLDGVNPSVVMCRGYYDHGCPTNLVAYDLKDGKLVKRWKFLANSKQNIEYTNQGNHNLGVGDIDGDGKDEIVYGAMAVDHNGVGIYTTGLEHGDAMHLGNFTTKTPNLDFFQIHEHAHAEFGFESRDPATGVISWGYYTGMDTARGLCAKIDPRYEGNQCWIIDGSMYTMEGELITEKAPKSVNFAIWWDGDLIRELLDHKWDGEEGIGIGQIYKWDYENNKLVTILDTKDAYSNNWTKGNPCIQADILGDWREEAIWRNPDSTELRIYTTTHPTEHTFYTLMHDEVYRLSIAWQNTAYNQPPHTGFYIGPEMKSIPEKDYDYTRGEIIPDFTEDV